MRSEVSADVSEDTLLGGRVRLLQPRRGHRAGTDAVLLAADADIRPGDHVVDLGSGSGAVGLMIAARHPDTRITLIDRDPWLVELASANIDANGLAGRACAIVADAFDSATLRGLAEQGDHVVTNPPFFAAGTRASPEPALRAAHVMGEGGLSGWLQAAAGLLKHRRRLTLIHRPDSLGECMDGLGPQFGSLAILPVHPRAGADAARIIISAMHGGRSRLRIRPPLILHGQDGSFTPEAEALHRLPQPGPA